MLYFAYGSNMNEDRMRKRKINYDDRERATLKGYVLKFNKVASRNDKEGFANIEQKKDGIVEGILYYGILTKDFKKLDKLEGCPGNYYRTDISVNLSNRTKEDAIAYVAHQSKVKEGLKPTKEYLRHLLAGKDLLPESYYERLELNPTLD